jgi:SCP-2 sterol transfer family
MSAAIDGSDRLCDEHRMLPPPAGIPVYVLTALGERLRPVITNLALFGMDLPVDQRIDRDTARAELIALLRSEFSRPAASAGVHEAYQFRVGDEVFHVVADDGVVRTRSGPSPTPPAVSASCDFGTFLGLVSGRLSASRALKDGRVEIEGPAPALTRATRVLAP